MSDVLSKIPPSALMMGEAALSESARGWHVEASRHGGRRRWVFKDIRVPLGAGKLLVATENIELPTQWELQEDCHTVIVHLHGEMERLETRIERSSIFRGLPCAGDIWVVPAGRHYVGRARGGAIAYAELQVSPRLIADLTHATHAPAFLPRMKHRDPLLHGLITRIVTLSDAEDDLARMLRETLANAVFLHLAREYTESPCVRSADATVGTTLGAREQRRLDDYIHGHLDQHLSLDELATLVGLGPHQFLAAFRQSFGISPMQHVIRERLRLACSLLGSTRQDITTIAMATGFSSHSHLTAAFKQHFGITPRQYRIQTKGLRT